MRQILKTVFWSSFFYGFLSFASQSTHKSTPEHESKAKSSAAKSSPSESKAGQILQKKADCERLPSQSVSELWEKASCFQEIGNYVDAVENLRNLSSQNPRELEAFFAASWLLTQLSRTASGSDENKYALESLEELQRAKVANPEHWEVYVELGDYYFLYAKPAAFDKAYKAYLEARKLSAGNTLKGIAKANAGRKAAIENRIARTAEKLGRPGEAVEASCLALLEDPDDKAAEERIVKYNGSCPKKGIGKKSQGEEHH